MDTPDNLFNDSLEYVHHELQRLQTIAGTLSAVETRHFQDLTNFGDDRLNQIAIEEQNAARQLGEVKQICLSLAQRVEELKNGMQQ
ncbi:hypothetical protein [Paenibacillus sp. 32O-W]|uniref:hypothetical protein n=1 Tax=Paenibacillus sp. 32O-W TaxID=1695218 RepID=UPI0011A94B36|nr:MULTISPECIES: hypothetical protein [Paenibacillaceae]